MVRLLCLVPLTAALAGAALTLAGCNNATTPSAPPPSKATASGAAVPTPKGDGEHGHKPTAHGGIVVPIGSDSYHAEAVFEKGGILRLYTLGQNEATVL